MKPQDFIALVVGKPWVNRAVGPDSYDCWGLVIKSFELVDEIEMPSIAGYIESDTPTHIAAKSEIIKPWWIDGQNVDGDVSWYFDHKGRFVHVGRVMCGGILHSSGLSGVGAVKWERKEVVSSRFSKTEYKKYAND